MIFLKIDELLEEKEFAVVCIEGMSASGKTTLAAKLKEMYDCNVFHTDDFFLEPSMRTQERLAEPGGNVQYERLEELKNKIIKRESFSISTYDCKTDSYNTKSYEPKKLNIIEGVYSAHERIRNIYDLMMFMSIDKDVQKERILKRNGEVMLKKFESIWLPLEELYFKTLSQENFIPVCINLC